MTASSIWRSTSANAASHAASSSWVPSNPESAGVARTSAETRAGCVSAKSTATLPPIELPINAARSTPAASITAARSSTCEYGLPGSGRLERP